MIALKKIVNIFLKEKNLESSSFQQNRLNELERKINKNKDEETLSEVIQALEKEFSYKLDKNAYREIEKAARREMGKIY